MSQPSLDFLGAARPDRCVNHPEIDATQRCRQCRAAICATCDFVFPGDVHLCPTCATTTTSRPLASSRKTTLAASFVAALFTTAVLVAAPLGAFESAAQDEAFVQLLGMVVLVSVVLGLGLSLASLDGRAGNPPACWLSAAWNVVLAVIFFGRIVVAMIAG